MSEAEYLALERERPEKHEFIDGRAVAMAGATWEHNRIVANMVGLLGSELSGRPCVVQPSDLKVKVESKTRYYYPDATVICGAPQFVDGKRDAIVNPTVIVEVLSDSTEKDDRGRKFHDYQRIPSFTDYLLCSSDEPLVEHYSREADGSWRLRTYGNGDVIELRSIEVTISVERLYLNVFPAS
jgi:Uma2 family endonuclease